jgi:hypothetical protein
MDDALLVRRFDGVDDLVRDGQRLVERQRSLRQALCERRPLDELHHEGRCATRLLESVHLCDVRVVERGQQLGLALEARQALAIGGEKARENLHRDIAIELRVAGPIHLPHAASAYCAEDLVGSEAGTGVEGHLTDGEVGL